MTSTTLTEKRQFWLRHIRQCEKAGIPIIEYCQQHQLNRQKFYQFKSELRKKGIPFSSDQSASNFVPVSPTHHTPRPGIEREKKAFNLHMAIDVSWLHLELHFSR